MALRELRRKEPDDPGLDALREGRRGRAPPLIEREVSEGIGAQRYERTPSRTMYRNGYRPRRWDPRVGTVELQIPQLRRGSDFPSLLEPRRHAERALLAVVQEAYGHGVSPRKVDERVQALGIAGLSKSEVSRICAELDRHMERFRNRPLAGAYPSVWLDAKAVKVRQDGGVVHMAAVIAVGVRETGEREVLGFDVGAAETDAFWLEFLRRWVARGRRGVRLVISEAHEGLKRGIAEVRAGATGQRCRVHFMRNRLARAVHGGGAGADHRRPAGPRPGSAAVPPGGEPAAGGGGGGMILPPTRVPISSSRHPLRRHIAHLFPIAAGSDLRNSCPPADPAYIVY